MATGGVGHRLVGSTGRGSPRISSFTTCVTDLSLKLTTLCKTYSQRLIYPTACATAAHAPGYTIDQFGHMANLQNEEVRQGGLSRTPVLQAYQLQINYQ
jgi:hypothetical protein